MNLDFMIFPRVKSNKKTNSQKDIIWVPIENLNEKTFKTLN